MSDETKRWVPSYEGLYYATDGGRIFSVRGNRYMRGNRRRKGYVWICLSCGGKVSARSVHSVIMETFIGPRPTGAHIDHIDGDTSNNALRNLRYVTPRENVENTMRLGRQAKGERNGQSKLTEAEVFEIRAAKQRGGRYWGAAKLAAKFGVHRTQIERAGRMASFGYLRAHCAAAVRALGE